MDRKFTILIPYRPSRGSMCSLCSPITQLDDNTWKPQDPKFIDLSIRKEKDDLLRAIAAINKNSYYKHDIVVVIDSDMTPRENWLKEYDNVRILQVKYVCNEPVYIPIFRLTAAMYESIFSLDDNALVFQSYLCDLICSKKWDKYIFAAIDTYGTDCTYTPMWVETRVSHSMTRIDLTKLEERKKMYPITVDKIWDTWRQWCCHELTLPPPLDKEYFIEKDFDDWIAISNQFDKDVIIEPCGARVYGYYNAYCATAKRFKEQLPKIPLGTGWDTGLESLMGKKIVVTKSYILHSHDKFELDSIDVKDKENELNVQLPLREFIL